jgi:hypothetical protein
VKDLLRETLGNSDDHDDAIDVDVDEDAMTARYGEVFGRALAEIPGLSNSMDRYYKQDM